MNPLVSITVPIYNEELYLQRCIESLLNQTLENIEIILVDDGSTDKSGDICDNYAQKDGRIKVFHKVNGGSASARQLGLENSSGEYYTVCDADDWVEPNMYKDLYNKAIAEDADIVLSNLYLNYPNGKELIAPVYIYTNQERYILDIMSHKALANTVNKLFKLDSIKRNNVTYEKGINLGEDALFLYKLLLHPMHIVSIDKPYYHYRREINSNSYTNNITMDSLNQAVFIANWRKQYFHQEKYEVANYSQTIALVCVALRVKDLNMVYFNSKILKEISVRKILRYRIFTIKAMVAILVKILGCKIVKKMSGMYKFIYK